MLSPHSLFDIGKLDIQEVKCVIRVTKRHSWLTQQYKNWLLTVAVTIPRLPQRLSRNSSLHDSKCMCVLSSSATLSYKNKVPEKSTENSDQNY